MNIVKFKKGSDLINDPLKTIFQSPLFSNWENALSTNFVPKVRISEDKDNFYINMEIPGLKKEDIKVAIEDKMLTINGVKKHEKKTEETNLITNEIYYGEFSRSFNISDDIKIDGIDAEVRDGVLFITLPKVEEAKPVVKEISVK
ncbi:MAG: Hsp20/alpha crystallin family protein [Ignavibacteria bacterium]|jgi:HSP20 family protein|nr:Hsp20/alpha crystallin family protein [Ignavibacteria bacterium]